MTVVLDLAARTDGRRSLLAAVTVLCLVGGPGAAYVIVGSQIGLGDLLLVAAVALGLAIPPDRLATAMIPAWLFAPMSGWVLAVARGATCALALGLVLRFAVGALRLRRSHAWLALFAAALIISLLYPATTGPATTLPGYDLTGILAGLVVAAAAVAAPPDPAVAARAVAVAGAVASAIVLAGGDFDGGRLVGAGLNTNYVGAMLALACVAAAGLAWTARQPGWLVVAAPSAFAVVQTQSRGALVAVAAGIGYLALRNRSWRQRALFVAAAALLTVLVTDSLPALLINGRTATELDANNAIRGEALRLAIQIALENPLRGIGYGMFPLYAAGTSQVGIFINTHNEYARLACEAGLPTAAIFGGLLLLAMRGRRTGDEAVLRAVVVVFAVSLLFGNFLSSMVVSVSFWLALGYLLAGARTPRPS
ncbi:MAG: O-antigen ligase family protein [Actinoplanes sp.]